MARRYGNNRHGESSLPQPGRAVGGISGGGDTPEKTLWKLYAQYAYICGVYENGRLFIEGPDEARFFGADENGRIRAFVSTGTVSIEQLKDLLTPYFEEISTVQILVVEGLAVGDDIPNWESYELLE